MELKKIKYEDVPNRALIVYFLECIKDYFYPNRRFNNNTEV